MPHIDLTRTHPLGRDGARRVAERVAADLRAQYQARTHWDGDTLRLDGPGVHGALRQVREKVNAAISVGERLHTRWEFVPVFEQELAANR